MTLTKQERAEIPALNKKIIDGTATFMERDRFELLMRIRVSQIVAKAYGQKKS